MNKLVIPKKIKKGDTIITVSLSWGGPGTYRYRYDEGVKELEKVFGVYVKNSTHALKDAKFIYKNPLKRAKDLMDSFENKNVKAIISTIGGEDSIRILPYINFDIILKNPKIFLGYSDSTITHFICYKAGLRTYYGPSIMGGFDENGGIFTYTKNSLYKTLFTNEIIGKIEENDYGWTNEFLDWGDENNSRKKRKLNKVSPRRFIQGKGKIQGELLGGCIDVFPFMWGTKIWPNSNEWKGKILFFELSEEEIPIIYFERILRIMGVQGILKNLNGIIVGKTKNNNNYESSILKIVNDEFGLNSLHIITNMDFGHISPVFIIPIGAKAEIDSDNKIFSINESGVK